MFLPQLPTVIVTNVLSIMNSDLEGLLLVLQLLHILALNTGFICDFRKISLKGYLDKLSFHCRQNLTNKESQLYGAWQDVVDAVKKYSKDGSIQHSGYENLFREMLTPSSNMQTEIPRVFNLIRQFLQLPNGFDDDAMKSLTAYFETLRVL